MKDEVCADRMWEFKVITEKVRHMSRIDPIMKNLIGNEKPDDLATEILDVLTEESNVPEAGIYYSLYIVQKHLALHMIHIHLLL